jgi:hypothetical protein
MQIEGRLTLPFKTYSFPCLVIVMRMFVASLLATSGSVIKKADRILPSSNGSIHCLFCFSVPYLANTSMLPVSGAAQFVASDAKWPWARTSAIKPYSRLEKPAPSLKCPLARNMFQRPSLRALTLSSSMIAGWLLNRCSVVSPIWAT